jgi:hypothetical protein
VSADYSSTSDDGGGDGSVPSSPSRLDRPDSFGGKDLSKFPVIPESPNKGRRQSCDSQGSSPNKKLFPSTTPTGTPRKVKSFGRDLVAALRPALRLGRGVSNSASSLIPRSFTAERNNAVRIGIARDAAFCHYYRENLTLLEAAGADLVPFSPVAGDSLPTVGAAAQLLHSV